jgi:hypothetical protein
MRARRCVVTIGDELDADYSPMGAGLTSILALCGTTAQDVRSIALRPSVGVPSLPLLVGDRQP